MEHEHNYHGHGGYGGQPAGPKPVDDFRPQTVWHPHAHHQGHHNAAAHEPAKPAAVSARGASPLQPVPVIKMWSTRGMEYAMMSVSLWITAATTSWIILDLANGSRSFNFLLAPTSAIVIGLPVFAFFFLRLKRAELNSPALRTDPSRRRWTQLTQFLAFLATIANLIVLVYELLARYGTSHSSRLPSKVVLDAVIVLVIAGGILAYYWIDEHRALER